MAGRTGTRLEALKQKVSDEGRIVDVNVATVVNAEERREIIGMDVGASKDVAFCLQFMCPVAERGVSAVELVTSSPLAQGCCRHGVG